jgi:hypothetical protein
MRSLQNLPPSIVREIILFYGVDADQKKKMSEVLKAIVVFDVSWTKVETNRTRRNRLYELRPRPWWESMDELWGNSDAYYQESPDFQINANLDEYSHVKSRNNKGIIKSEIKSVQYWRAKYTIVMSEFTFLSPMLREMADYSFEHEKYDIEDEIEKNRNRK